MATIFDDEIDVSIADPTDQVPEDMLDDIVEEYLRGVIFDGVRVVATAQG